MCERCTSFYILMVGFYIPQTGFESFKYLQTRQILILKESWFRFYVMSVLFNKLECVDRPAVASLDAN